MILVPLLNPKVATTFAARSARTSASVHERVVVMTQKLSIAERSGQGRRQPGRMSLGRGRRLRWRVILVGVLAVSAVDAALVQPRAEEDDPTVPAERRGLRLVRMHCSRCHAINQVGESPLASAPPFRTLRLKYPVADLQRPLAEGVHPVMPRFRFEPGQVEDIMAYLKTLVP
jgi:mono/diheme cytochrome c family protein